MDEVDYQKGTLLQEIRVGLFNRCLLSFLK